MFVDNLIEEISITELPNVKIGSSEDFEGGTGCTVILCEDGAPAGVDVRGGGPASRETQLLNPTMAMDKINAVVLSGGSAFGLDASGGVMSYLESKGIGFDVGVTKVPIVCQSSIFDLTVGSMKKRPNFDMAVKACENAEINMPEQGCYGGGVGATVGKVLGMDRCTKSGIGIYAAKLGGLMVGAIVVVNAFGDIFDFETGKKVAGVLNKDKTKLSKKDCQELMFEFYSNFENQIITNTTIGAVLTNANFDKTHMTKVAQMAQDGYSRSICPVHTTLGGDTIYALSLGDLKADINLVGTLSAYVTSKAIVNAIKFSKSMYGFKAVCDLL